MLNPTLEIVLFLSATFLLGLALGWAIWYLGAKHQMSSIASERDFWKKSYDQARLQSTPNQEFSDPLIQRSARKPRSRASSNVRRHSETI